MPSGLQVLVAAQDSPRIAGLPLFLRNAQKALKELSPERLLFSGDERFLGRWKRQFSNLGGSALSSGASAIDPDKPLLIVSGAAAAPDSALARFFGAASEARGPLRLAARGKTVAFYFPRAAGLLDSASAPAEIAAEGLGRKAPMASFETAGEDWPDGSDPAFLKREENGLFALIPQPTDGFIASLDRRVSMPLSRLLIRTPVTPNQITTMSGILGLYGAWLLAAASYGDQVFGAFLLWVCCILDGCDGEVARLKLMGTPSGGLYDVVVDNIVHVAIFVAIPLHVRAKDPGAQWLLPGILIVTGFLACMFSVWWLVLRRPKEERGEAGLLVERLASRDFIYLILLLTVIGKLEWFLWACAFGSHLFNIGLWAALGRRTHGQGGRKKTPS